MRFLADETALSPSRPTGDGSQCNDRPGRGCRLL